MIRWKLILSEMRKVRQTVEEATRMLLKCTVPKMPPNQFIFLNYITSKWYFCRNIHIKQSSKSIYPKDKPGSMGTTPLDSCVTTEVTWIETCELCSTAAGFIHFFFFYSFKADWKVWNATVSFPALWNQPNSWRGFLFCFVFSFPCAVHAKSRRCSFRAHTR